MRYFVGILAGVAVVVLGSVLMDESARVDGALVEPEVFEPLVDAAREREPSVFDTHDYGPVPSLESLDRVVAVAVEGAAARDELERARRGRTGTPESTYDARAQPWEGLPPARVAESSDDCVGYCFDAIVESVDGDDSRVARVVVFGEGGAPSRAVVERTRMSDTSRSATYYGDAVHFTCFEKADAAPVPRFEGCAQMARERRGLGASRGGKSRQDSDLKVFDLADPL